MFLPILTLLSVAFVALPATAKDPRSPKSPPPAKIAKSSPWNIPNAQALVNKGKISPFYNPDDLSLSPVISAPSAILVDADSGQVLWEKDAEHPRPIASTTKIMTALLLVEHSNPEDVIICNDQNITKIEESSLHIKPGEKFTAENLLVGFMLRSGNDAGVLIAEHVAGSVPSFADMMNQRAAELGCTSTHFVNPHGLTEPGHYSTAHDLARIACEAMRNPRFAEAVRLPRRTIERSINKEDIHIVSRMKKRFHDRFPGADGVKTGNTQAAGFCYVGSATRDGHRLISVVLGARGGSSINDTIVLQGWGFRRFSSVLLAKQGDVVGQAEVIGGATATVPAVLKRDLKTVTDKIQSGTPLTTRFVPESSTLTAPIAQGTEIGKVVVQRGATILFELPALAARDVPVAPLQAAVKNTGNWMAHGLYNPVFWSVGGVALSLVLWRTYARTITKSAGSRRNRIASTRGRDHRDGAGSRGRGDGYTTGNAR